MKHKISFAFFGTSHIAVYVLDALEAAGYVPALIVTLPEKKKGRGLQDSETAVATWARTRSVPLSYEWTEFEADPPAGGWDVAIVVDYGKILPKRIIDIPKKGFLNVHPSLLPRLRGPSPMRSALLGDDKHTGVTILLLDEQMDHGPIVAQKHIPIDPWPIKNSELEAQLLPAGGALLAQMLEAYVDGDIEPKEQNHDIATYSEKFTKEDGELDLHADGYANLLKIRAYEGWPGTYAFFERPSTGSGQAPAKRIRVGIIDAHMEGSKLIIDIVKPEGKKEMRYEEFLRSGAKPIR